MLFVYRSPALVAAIHVGPVPQSQAERRSEVRMNGQDGRRVSVGLS
jgi:hypothetical protein